MQVTHGLIRGAIVRGGHSKGHAQTSAKPAGSKYAIGEINAYIAIRDELLMEAEELRTRAKLDSVIVANDFVATCLKPARPPYQAQFLPETAAVRERARCQAVKNRVAELRARTLA
jgi:hypothetical protein